ncbi:MAG: cysteine desulfurase family protein, partial [Flavobacteriales bacterium]
EHIALIEKGHIDMASLEELLSTGERALVALMHANNEMGNMIHLDEVADLCGSHNAVFLSDTVQTMAHFPFDLSSGKIHFIAASAHKFHGPKGIGFIYINNDLKLKPLLYGGHQERNMRAGTENIYGIAGLAKAMEIAYSDLDEHRKHISGLKRMMMDEISANIPGAEYVGDPDGHALYTVLTVAFPEHPKAEMLLFNLDIEGIAVSGGSACVSGASKSSHVMETLHVPVGRPVIRFSFSRYNTAEEVLYCIGKLKKILNL